MECPDCHSINYYKHGDRRECKDCGKWYRPGSTGQRGRPRKYDQPMTNTERQREWRERQAD